MYGKYRPLLPARSVRDTTAWPSLVAANKRKRIGVAVACDCCRARKMRCDGQRPACGECDKRGDKCIYNCKASGKVSGSSSGSSENITGSTRSTSSNIAGKNAEDIVEAIQLLNSMPPQETIYLLRSLQNMTDANTILTYLRSRSTKSITQPSAAAAVSGTLQKPALAVELERRQPFVYPALPPIDVSLFQRLVRPTGIKSLPELPLARPPTQKFVHGVKTMLQPPSTQLSIYEQLNRLRISQWTNVPVTDGFASRVILLYLETDHPLLCPFDPELFIRALVNVESSYCTPLLVNAVMYWACQMYSAVDNKARCFVEPFCAEAERLWGIEQPTPSALTMTAAQFLSFGYLVQGKNHAVLAYLSEAIRIGTQLGLFGVTPDVAQSHISKFDPEEMRATAYSAWGTFNWIMLMGLFYHQPGVKYPAYPPVISIPGKGEENSDMPGWNSGKSESAGMFPVFCEFWRIMHGMAITYYRESTSIPERVPLNFAEEKFRELMEWSSHLPSKLARNEYNPHHVVIFHLWLHAAILDIFRPFLRKSLKKRRLVTFSSPAATPDALYAASVEQLKRLIIIYRFNYISSAYTIVWHTALLYVANAVLQTRSDNWLFYFLLCLYGYESLRTPYRVAEPIARGLLSMAMRSGCLSSDKARRVLADLEDKGKETATCKIRATFMLDLDLAMSDPNAANAETVAEMFEDTALMKDYTNAFPES